MVQIHISPLNTIQHRNYERHIFFYVFLMTIVLQIGWFLFRQFSLFSNEINILLNFIIFLLLAICIILIPNVYEKYLNKFVGQDKFSVLVINKLYYNFEYERLEQEKYLRANGFLIPNNIEINAVRIVFCIMLFELFFVHGCLDKDWNLIWKVNWIQNIIDWMIKHSENNDPTYREYWFSIELEGDLKIKYIDVETFLSSPLGQATMLLHFWRIITYYVCFLCVAIVMWKPLDWLGMEKVNPKNINGIKSFFIAFICTFFMNIFLILTLVVPILSPMAEPIGAAFTFLYPIKVSIFHIGIYLFVMVLGLFPLKLYAGWFLFWKQIYLKFRS